MAKTKREILTSRKVLLHGTIRNDDFLRNTASQYWNNVVSIQNNVATLCCAKKTSHICDTRRFATTIFSTIQRCNIVSTLF